MIKIKGKYAEADVYVNMLDSGSEGFIKALCGSVVAEGCKIRIMPDVHPGKGSVVGMTMTLNGKAVPGLIGPDIGCGMEVIRIKAKRLELQKLDKLVWSKIPSGMNIRTSPHRFADMTELEKLCCLKHIKADKALLGIGTLGGGNHFIELDKADSGYYLIIHSGSRHLGVETEKFYHELAYKYVSDDVPYEFAYLEGELFDDYLHDIKIVQDFAQIIQLNASNINEFGRYDDLKKTVDKSKAKAYFEKLEGRKIIPPKVNVKVDNLLRDFILSGGFEIGKSDNSDQQ